MRAFKKFPIGLHVVYENVAHMEVMDGPDVHSTYLVHCHCEKCDDRRVSTVTHKARGDMQGIFILVPPDYNIESIKDVTDQKMAVSVLGVFSILRARGYDYLKVLDLIQEAAYRVFPEVKEYLE